MLFSFHSVLFDITTIVTIIVCVSLNISLCYKFYSAE